MMPTQRFIAAEHAEVRNRQRFVDCFQAMLVIVAMAMIAIFVWPESLYGQAVTMRTLPNGQVVVINQQGNAVQTTLATGATAGLAVPAIAGQVGVPQSVVTQVPTGSGASISYFSRALEYRSVSGNRYRGIPIELRIVPENMVGMGYRSLRVTLSTVGSVPVKSDRRYELAIKSQHYFPDETRPNLFAPIVIPEGKSSAEIFLLLPHWGTDGNWNVELTDNGYNVAGIQNYLSQNNQFVIPNSPRGDDGPRFLMIAPHGSSMTAVLDLAGRIDQYMLSVTPPQTNNNYYGQINAQELRIHPSKAIAFTPWCNGQVVSAEHAFENYLEYSTTQVVVVDIATLQTILKQQPISAEALLLFVQTGGNLVVTNAGDVGSRAIIDSWLKDPADYLWKGAEGEVKSPIESYLTQWQFHFAGRVTPIANFVKDPRPEDRWFVLLSNIREVLGVHAFLTAEAWLYWKALPWLSMEEFLNEVDSTDPTDISIGSSSGSIAVPVPPQLPGTYNGTINGVPAYIAPGQPVTASGSTAVAGSPVLGDDSEPKWYEVEFPTYFNGNWKTWFYAWKLMIEDLRNEMLWGIPPGEIKSLEYRDYLAGRIVSVRTKDLFALNSAAGIQISSILGGRDKWSDSHIGNGAEGNWNWMIPSLGSPPVWVFCGLLTLFVIGVGPGSFWVCRRSDRRHWFLVLVPMLALVATASLFTFAMVREGGTRAVRIRSATLVNQRAGTAATFSRQTLFCGFAPTSGLQFPKEAFVVPFITPGSDSNYSYGFSKVNLRWGENQQYSALLRSREQSQVECFVPAGKSQYFEISTDTKSGDLQVKNISSSSIASFVATDVSGSYYFGGKCGIGETIKLTKDDQTSCAVGMQRVLSTVPLQVPDGYRIGQSNSLLDFGRRSYYAWGVSSSGNGVGVLERSIQQNASERMDLPPRSFAAITFENSEVAVPIENAQEIDSLHVITGAW